jgi:hypothetical protein
MPTGWQIRILDAVHPHVSGSAVSNAARRYSMSAGGRSLTEAGVAATLSLLAVLTAFHPNWIELAFGIDPDSGSGLIEWALILVPALISIACATVAYRKWSSARV